MSIEIPRLAERTEAARLWQAQRDASITLQKARDFKATDEVTAKYDKLFEELDEEHERRVAALLIQQDAELGLADLKAQADAAENAYDAYPARIRLGWDAEKGRVPLRCAKSGHVILVDDEDITDRRAGETYLRAALGLPPRPAIFEDDEGEEAEDDDRVAA